MSNHLGNVQVVITDKRIAVCNEELEVSRFEAEVLVATDYYPFGMIMPGRDWTYQECTEGFYDTSYSFDQLSFTFSVQTLTTGQDVQLGYTLFPAMPLPVLTQYQSGHTLQDYIDEIVTNGSNVSGFTFTQTDIDEVTFTVDASGGFLDCGDTFIIHAPWQSYYFYATCSEQVKWVQDCKDVGYRYGFNGMEKDNEVKGSGNSLDFGARIYDSRLGRWLSLDPMHARYPAFSPYNFCLNSPNLYIDPNGEEPIPTKYVTSIKQEKGKKPVITIEAEVTIKVKIYNNSSNKHVDMSTVRDLMDYYGESMLGSSGTIDTKSMFKFDGEGGTFDKPTDVRIEYSLKVNLDIEVISDVNKIDKNNDVVIYQDKIVSEGKEVHGLNHGIISEALVENKYSSDNYILADIGIHELFHGYGAGDKYKKDDKGNVTDPAIGNVMGVVQQIDKVGITSEQQKGIALNIFQSIESMKKNKTDYSGINNKDAKKETKKLTDK